MVISIDKATAVKMFDKVQKYWQQYIARLKSEITTQTGSERIFCGKGSLHGGDHMAVVVSPGQNEIVTSARRDGHQTPPRPYER